MLFLFLIIAVIFILPVVMGLSAALVLLFIRPLRHLATYFALVPLVGAAGAWMLSWGLALYLEGSYHYSISGFVFVLGFLIGGILGSILGVLSAFALNRSLRHLIRCCGLRLPH
jgi:hypothetical protein